MRAVVLPEPDAFSVEPLETVQKPSPPVLPLPPSPLSPPASVPLLESYAAKCWLVLLSPVCLQACVCTELEPPHRWSPAASLLLTPNSFNITAINNARIKHGCRESTFHTNNAPLQLYVPSNITKHTLKRTTLQQMP